jgi:hypothetical protein
VVETRIAPRYRVMKAARIKFGTVAVNCMVHDLSTSGAALEVTDQVGIPAKFTLVMPNDGLHLPCHVVWRKQFRLGVTFE